MDRVLCTPCLHLLLRSFNNFWLGEAPSQVSASLTSPVSRQPAGQDQTFGPHSHLHMQTVRMGSLISERIPLPLKLALMKLEGNLLYAVTMLLQIPSAGCLQTPGLRSQSSTLHVCCT